MNSRPGCCPCTSPNPRKGHSVVPFFDWNFKRTWRSAEFQEIVQYGCAHFLIPSHIYSNDHEKPRPKSHNSRPQASNFALHNTAESVTYYTTHRGNVQRRKTMPCSAPSKQSRQPHADHAARHFPPECRNAQTHSAGRLANQRNLGLPDRGTLEPVRRSPSRYHRVGRWCLRTECRGLRHSSAKLHQQGAVITT
jgi:hypothetical protein